MIFWTLYSSHHHPTLFRLPFHWRFHYILSIGHASNYLYMKLFIRFNARVCANEIIETCNKRFWIHLQIVNYYRHFWLISIAFCTVCFVCGINGWSFPDSRSLWPHFYVKMFLLALFKSINQSIAAQISVVYHTYTLNIEYIFICSNFC